MNQLKMKAKAGVTLVELLVVILIVTILSVSMLPLLKPFVVEAQYAAEAIPAIGNLRTKVGLYQYDKGNLPSVCTFDTTLTDIFETWGFSDGNGTVSSSPTDAYVAGYKSLVSEAASSDTQVTTYTPGSDASKGNWGYLIDVDNQDLVGKRCKPVHFQYAVMANGSTYCYVIGCFGDNNGLPEGTGYAICELSVKANDGNVYKQIGTWKRYKATTDGQITFGTITSVATDSDTAKKSSTFCAIPAKSLFESPNATSGELDIVGYMESYGWEF